VNAVMKLRVLAPLSLYEFYWLYTIKWKGNYKLSEMWKAALANRLRSGLFCMKF
jgi:hypothetical protein